MSSECNWLCSVFQHFIVICISGPSWPLGRMKGWRNSRLSGHTLLLRAGDPLRGGISNRRPAPPDRPRQDALWCRIQCHIRYHRARRSVVAGGLGRVVRQLLASWVLASLDCKPVGDSITRISTSLYPLPAEKWRILAILASGFKWFCIKNMPSIVMALWARRLAGQ